MIDKELVDDAKEMLDSGSLNASTFDDLLNEYGCDDDPMELLEMLI